MTPKELDRKLSPRATFKEDNGWIYVYLAPEVSIRIPKYRGNVAEIEVCKNRREIEDLTLIDLKTCMDFAMTPVWERKEKE